MPKGFDIGVMNDTIGLLKDLGNILYFEVLATPAERMEHKDKLSKKRRELNERYEQIRKEAEAIEEESEEENNSAWDKTDEHWLDDVFREERDRGIR